MNTIALCHLITIREQLLLLIIAGGPSVYLCDSGAISNHQRIDCIFMSIRLLVCLLFICFCIPCIVRLFQEGSLGRLHDPGV